MSDCHSIPKHSAGFTLVELMVVLVIFSILMALAVPAYQRFVLQAGRAEGRTLLRDAAAQEERYYAQNGRYTSEVKKLGLPYGLKDDEQLSPTGLYRLVVVSADDNSFYLTAEPVGHQAKDECGALDLTGQGEGSSHKGDPDECWEQ